MKLPKPKWDALVESLGYRPADVAFVTLFEDGAVVVTTKVDIEGNPT